MALMKNCRLWLLAWGCLLVQHVLVQAQSGEQLVIVRTGQQLADAVALWGGTGSNMTIQIDVAFISVRNASFQTSEAIAAKTGRQPFSSGRLIIRGQGQPSSPPTTVLDAGMRILLIPGVSGSARFTIEDLILVNLCEWTSVGLGIQYTTPFAYSLFANSPAYVGRALVNVYSYVRHWALTVLIYQLLMQSAIMPEFRDAAASVLSTSGPQSEPNDVFGTYMLGSKVYINSDTAMRNIVIKSLDNPGDALLSKLKMEGVVMPPMFCYGAPLNETQLNRQSQRIGPVWIGVDQSSFVSAVANATAYTAQPPLIKGMPVIVAIAHNSVTIPDTSYQVLNRLMFTSNKPGNLLSWDAMLNISMHQRAAWLYVAPGADVMFQFLGLSGLAVQVPTRVPPSLAGRSPDSLLPSVFPLAAFNTSGGPDTWGTAAQVILANCTLFIPPDDYMALFVLTSKEAKAGIPSCADPTLGQRVDQLQAGISSWTGSSAADSTLEQHMQASPRELLFATFVGWGLNTTLLRVVPTSPLAVPACQSSAQSSSSQSKTIALAVGLACGGVLLLAVVALLVFWLSRRRLQRASSTSSSSIVMSKPLGTICIIQEAESSRDGNSDSNNTLSVATSDPASRTYPKSCLHRFVHDAMASQQQVFAAIAGKAFQEPSTAPASPGIAAVEQDQLHDQIKDLQAKLRQDGNKLVLAGVLGSGSGGTVYMGLWRGLRVAVKTVVFHETARDMEQGDALQQRVIMETAIAASVGHRNLVATYHYDIKALVAKEEVRSVGGLEINMEEGHHRSEHHVFKLFLVQELCNTSLADGLCRALFIDAVTGKLDLPAVLSILIDVASGLEYLHSKGIIHGDLKPDNILLKLDASAGEGVVAKLTDFGLSTKLQPGDTHVSDYKSGTPFYIAPEVTLRHRLSTASDLFSFGVIMWELYMQRPPYVISRGMPAGGRDPAGWHPLFPDYPLENSPHPAYYDLSNRCLEHDPHVRPSAKEARKQLQALLKICKPQRGEAA